MTESTRTFSTLSERQWDDRLFDDYEHYSESFSITVARGYRNWTWQSLWEAEMSPEMRWALELLANLWYRSVKTATTAALSWQDPYHVEACEMARQGAVVLGEYSDYSWSLGDGPEDGNLDEDGKVVARFFVQDGDGVEEICEIRLDMTWPGWQTESWGD